MPLNPPVDIYGIADTGSDLVWTQCVPCDGCYNNQTNPTFDPLKSATYTDIYCESEKCCLINTGNCSQNTCSYTNGYLDSSTTKVVFAQEKVIMTSISGETVSVDIAFGSKRFSHCLFAIWYCRTDVTDPSIASKISFGNGSEVVGDGVVSSPLVAKDFKTPYFVTIEAISVGDVNVPFNPLGISKGNMFLDSRTPPTVFPQDFYNRLAAEVQKQIAMDPIKDDPDLGTRHCYRTKTNLEGPILTVHFENANVQLKPMHTFVPLKDGVYCFAMQGSNGGGIYGNFVQANSLIGFDMETMMLSFKLTDCTK
ncbi:hypothetical protein SO802_023653 [Lithocarpus litseifolius]|uniref:Peptidase A1 domain-containing protein n=1 Tax=Lithocarpus litseifolius TaxID=425828 RepID=A0AAW2C6T0_9ROSI